MEGQFSYYPKILKLAEIYQMQGKPELAREMIPLDRDFYVAIYRMEALDELLTFPGNVSVNLIKKDPTWKPLWSLPEFQAMLKKHAS